MKAAKILTLALIGFFVSALQAVVIVNWGPATDIVTGAQSTIGGEGSASIDFGTPSNPAIGASYYPNNTGKSPVFYFASTSTAGGLDVRILDNGGNNDEFRMSMRQTTEPFEVNGSIAIVWTKDGDGSNHGFLNGGDAGTATLTGLDATFNDNGSTTNSYVDIRWIIRLGSDFYASENFDYNGSPSLADPSAANWFNYTPGTDISSIGSAAALSSFADVTATGFVLEFAQTSTSTIYLIPEMTSFTANATVPEPASIGLLLGIFSLGFLILRRKR